VNLGEIIILSLINYLTVIDSDRSCTVAASTNPLHIMRSSATKLGCGTKSQPWVIEAQTGQTINFSLLEFGSDKIQLQQSCQQYGTLLEKSSRKNISICGHGLGTNSIFYKSISNIVEINLHATNNDEDPTEQQRILIGFQGNTNMSLSTNH